MQEGGVLDVCWTSFNCQSAWRSTVCPVLLSLSPPHSLSISAIAAFSLCMSVCS